MSQIAGVILLFILAVAAGAGIYVMASMDESATLETTSVTQPIEIIVDDSGALYANNEHNFQFLAPVGWAVRETTPSQGVSGIYFTVIANQEETNQFLSISVIDSDQADTVIDSFSVISREAISVDGVNSTKYTATDNKDGSPVTLITVPNGERSFHFTSYIEEVELDRILESFMIVQ
ncbi:MAG: hypothetical protein Q8Q20_03010 [bacterium]|nr:hypothetical protein [bacterium]